MDDKMTDFAKIIYFSMGQFWPQIHYMNKLGRGILGYTLNLKALGYTLLEKKTFQ